MDTTDASETLPERIQNDLVMLMEALIGVGAGDDLETCDPRMAAVLRPLIRRAERIDAQIWDEFPP